MLPPLQLIQRKLLQENTAGRSISYRTSFVGSCLSEQLLDWFSTSRSLDGSSAADAQHGPTCPSIWESASALRHSLFLSSRSTRGAFAASAPIIAAGWDCMMHTSW